jgi:hypothetical protein
MASELQRWCGSAGIGYVLIRATCGELRVFCQFERRRDVVVLFVVGMLPLALTVIACATAIAS